MDILGKPILLWITLRKKKKKAGVNIEGSQTEGTNVCHQIVLTEMNAVGITHRTDLMSLGFAM